MKRTKKLVLSSIVCISPLIAAILLYDQLPDQMAIHWNSSGEANGFISRNIGVWAIPLFLLVIHLPVVIGCERSSSSKRLAPFTRVLCFWAVPLASVIIVPFSLFKAAGYTWNITKVVLVFVCVLFVVAGNYLPKNQPNNIAGYKLPWTLSDNDNWNKTHRFAGAIWVICGFMLIVLSMISVSGHIYTVLIILGLIIAFLSPIVYSYMLKKSTHNQRHSSGG